MGTAVIANPTPRKRLYVTGSIAGARMGEDRRPMSSPSPNGTLTETSVTATKPLVLRRFLRWPNSKSVPIWNINRIRPIWLMMMIGVDAFCPNRACETSGKK